MRKLFLGMILNASFLISPVAGAWDLEKLRDVHNFNCGAYWEVNEKMSTELHFTIGDEVAIKTIGASVTNELYAQDDLWVSSGHKSYLHQISINGVVRVAFEIVFQCKDNPSKNMAEQVDESYKKFAEEHWNPFTDHDLDFLNKDEE